ncbi:MAG TPA: FtsX-like permease family protein [Myxococcota bacterium]|jgi:ABC-type lipoprotein release transport system permease subunit|nr:FtsX-like permease family protein [Myxococcota bacterium]
MLSTLRIAWRNLGRNRKRTALALTAIGVAQTALLLMDGLIQGYSDAMLDTVTGPMIGHVQVHVPKYREERGLDEVVPNLAAVLAAVRADPDVARAAPRVYAPALVARDVDAVAAVMIGVDPALEADASGVLGSSSAATAVGTSASGAVPVLGGRRALVGKILARDLGIAPGAKIAIVGQGADGSIANDLFVVAGVVSSPVDLVNRLGVVVSLADAQSFLALGDEAHEIVVHAKVPDRAGALAARLAASPALAGLEVLDWRALVPELASVLDISTASTFIILFLVFIASAAGVANTMLMATFERAHELGMLLALGCTPGRIVRTILLESLMLGVLGVALGSIAGAAAVTWASHTGIDLASLGSGGAGEMSYMGMNLSFAVFPRLQA